MSGDLLQTKLIVPRARPSLVPRPQLIEKLNAGLNGKLTLISAPAGFGKTTLVGSWIGSFQYPAKEDSGAPGREDTGFRFAWLSLDEGDRDPVRFLRYLIGAIQRAEPDLGWAILALLQSPEQMPIQGILTALLNELVLLPQPLILVLDDYQTAGVRPNNEALAFLVEHAPSQMHVVMTTREDPHLPLARLRARGQLAELRAADLRFSHLETAAFLSQTMGLQLAAGDVAILEKRTEGWIAGLQLAALALQGSRGEHGIGDADQFIESFAGSNRFILDYLVEEVLNQQTQHVRAFLLRTSILERMCGPLCDALLDGEDSDGQEMLVYLEQANLFLVPLDQERRWYRYHHLFADLLRVRLRQSMPGLAARLYARAAQWCARNGQLHEAVDYALAAPDLDLAAALIESHWSQVLNQGAIETLWSWLQTIPGSVIRSSAQLSLAYCWVLWFQGKIADIGARLPDIERAIGSHVGPGEVGLDAAVIKTAAQVAALRAFIARYQNDFATALTSAQQALAWLPENDPLENYADLRPIISLALASAYDGSGALEKAAEAYAETIYWNRLIASTAGVTGITYRLAGLLRLLGRLRAAEKACRDALAYVQAQGMAQLPPVGILHLALSEVLVEQNELEAAEMQLARGMELGKWGGRLDVKRNAAPALTRLRLARGDTGGALMAVADAQEMLGQPPSPLAHAELLALKTGILLRQGEYGAASRCAAEAQRLASWDRGVTGEMVALAASRLALATAEPQEATAELARSLSTAEQSGRLGAAIELHLLRSLALARQGKQKAAERDLAQALALAAPEGYVRLFLDEGRPIQKLLRGWRVGARSGPARDYALHLLSQFAAEEHAIGAAQEKAFAGGEASANAVQELVEPLTQRELEVLQVMALGKTNKEIAAQLVIAPGTVKAHTASIYSKLDVANRTEAVARARELGILT